MKLLTILLILISFLLLSLLLYLVLVQDECEENKEKKSDYYNNKEYIDYEWQALCMEGCDWDEECVVKEC